jgi:two-component system sensor histidine kinase UhpB
MNERAQQLGGKLEIQGTPLQGSSVILKIPLTIAATNVGESIND